MRQRLQSDQEGITTDTEQTKDLIRQRNRRRKELSGDFVKYVKRCVENDKVNHIKNNLNIRNPKQKWTQEIDEHTEAYKTN